MATNKQNNDLLVCDFEQIRRHDGAIVGGKNASLGEMINTLEAKGIAVPPGFATTAGNAGLCLTLRLYPTLALCLSIHDARGEKSTDS